MEHQLTLDLQNPHPIPTMFAVKQNDGGVHTLKFTLKSGEDGYELPEGGYYRVRILRNDESTTESENLKELSYTLSVADLNVSGEAFGEISVYDSSGGRITSAAFKFKVVPDINTDDGIENDGNYPLLTKLVNKVESLNNDARVDADRAEEKANTAEGFATAAEEAKGAAQDAAKDAITAAANAKESSTFASSASQHADNAAASAETAEQKAAEAKESADTASDILGSDSDTADKNTVYGIRAQVSEMKDNAETAADSAADSASSAALAAETATNATLNLQYYGIADVQPLSSEYYNYTDNGDGTCSIEWTEGIEGADKITVPYMVNELIVTSVKNTNKYTLSSATDIILPNTIKAIESYAFASAANVKKIDIPNSVESIGIFSFANCTALSEVYIPISVKSIGANAFLNCASLTIYCYTGSEAEAWAVGGKRNYILIDSGLREELDSKVDTADIDTAINAALTEAKESGEFDGDPGVSGVYVGSGDMPEGYNVQIDPDGSVYEIPYVTPQMCGAVGTGNIDDTEAFRRAIEYARGKSVPVRVPAGTYLITNTLPLYTDLQIIGDNGCEWTKNNAILGSTTTEAGFPMAINSAVIYFKPTDSDVSKLFSVDASNDKINNIQYYASNIKIENLYIRGDLEPNTDDDDTGVIAIDFNNVCHSSIKKVHIYGFGTGLKLSYTMLCNFEDMTIQFCRKYCCKITKGVNTTIRMHRCYFGQLRSSYCMDSIPMFIETDSCLHASFYNLTFESAYHGCVIGSRNSIDFYDVGTENIPLSDTIGEAKSIFTIGANPLEAIKNQMPWCSVNFFGGTMHGPNDGGSSDVTTGENARLGKSAIKVVSRSNVSCYGITFKLFEYILKHDNSFDVENDTDHTKIYLNGCMEAQIDTPTNELGDLYSSLVYVNHNSLSKPWDEPQYVDSDTFDAYVAETNNKFTDYARAYDLESLRTDTELYVAENDDRFADLEQRTRHEMTTMNWADYAVNGETGSYIIETRDRYTIHISATADSSANIICMLPIKVTHAFVMQLLNLSQLSDFINVCIIPSGDGSSVVLLNSTPVDGKIYQGVFTVMK